MVQATVQASGFVETGLALGSGENGWFSGGASFTAGGHLVMVCFGMGFRAERAEDSFKQANSGIRTMTEPPASSAPGKANVFLGGGDDKVMSAIYKRLSDEVLHGETATRVVDIKPHCPQI